MRSNACTFYTCFRYNECIILPTSLCVELIPDPVLGGFTARVPDVPAYGEGATQEEAIQDLEEALIGYAEAFGLEDLHSRITPQIELRMIA